MELMLALAAGAGLVTGIATTRIFGGRKEAAVVIPPTAPEPALEELRVLRALCGIPNVNSVRRYSLASEATEAMRSVLEPLIAQEVTAAAVTTDGGMLWAGLGDPSSLEFAGSFAARLDGVPEEVWRVTWRSQDGIELVAQRFPMVRGAQWLVCVASGTPVDRMRLARAAYESGLAAATKPSPQRDSRPLSPSELASWAPIRAVAEHTPLLAARVWTSGEESFSAGDVRMGQPTLSTQVQLEGWSQLVRNTLGSQVGTMYETTEARVCFHPIGSNGLLELTTGTTRPHPWRRAYAAARQLEHARDQREAG